ncbi:abortive infection bacteriophage resistance protein [Bradyrhizobium sp. JR6.1]
MARTPFKKPARELGDLTFLLATRGLRFENWADAHTHLEHIGYYRFTGYLRPFKIGGTGADAENFKPNTTFELVHDRYIFDRRLRILILEAVEKIEIAARAAISDAVACRHGPHWYMDRNLFARPGFYHRAQKFDVVKWHAAFLEDVKRQIGHDDARRQDVFVKHYYETYSDPDMPPCWMVFEIITFGSISQCLKFLKHPEYGEVCKKFGLSHQIISSWLHALSYVRNLCAHHSRLWNRVLTIKPTIPNAHRLAFGNKNDRIYAALLAMQILLQQIWSNNEWAENLRALIDEHPTIPLGAMGFPADWDKLAEWSFDSD